MFSDINDKFFTEFLDHKEDLMEFIDIYVFVTPIFYDFLMTFPKSYAAKTLIITTNPEIRSNG